MRVAYDVRLTRDDEPMKTFEAKEVGRHDDGKAAYASLLGQAFDYECSLGTPPAESLRLLTGLVVDGSFFKHHQNADGSGWKFEKLALIENHTTRVDLEFDSRINQVILTHDTGSAKNTLWSLHLTEVQADAAAYFRRLYKDLRQP